MRTSHALVETANATSYLRQLCRHWAHKFPVEFNDEHGSIQLPQALCRLDASPANLGVTLELHDDADQPHVEQVVEKHLQRFGFRETLTFHWTH